MDNYDFEELERPVQQIPKEYKPIGMWGYFGFNILFDIPILGFFIALILALVARNRNVKNFAKSYFCTLILTIILIIAFVIFCVATGVDLEPLFETLPNVFVL